MTALVPPDLIPNWIPGEKTLDSSHLGWSGLTLKGYRYPDQEANIPLMRDYMIVVYEGAKAIMQRMQRRALARRYHGNRSYLAPDACRTVGLAMGWPDPGEAYLCRPRDY
jgi:hypothetical protein